MSGDDSTTLQLLERWRIGDADALGVLLERDMEWIRNYVRQHLGDHLRRAGETDDFVQEAALAALRYGPRFVLTSRAHFRGLLAKITLNILRTRHREVFALKRSPVQERPLSSDSVLYLDPPHDSVTRPDARAAEEEAREWVRLGLLLLTPADQEVIGLHFQGLSDPDIAKKLDLMANTVRMRRKRAEQRLTKVVLKLKSGQIDEALAMPDEAL